MTGKDESTANMSFQSSLHQKQGGKGNMKNNPITKRKF